MPDIIQVEQAFTLLTANGGATGALPVADTSVFFSGCTGFVGSSGQPTVRIVIVQVDDVNKIVYGRIIANDNEQQLPIQVYGGKSNFTAYTTAQGAYVSMEAQLARVEYNYNRIIKRNI